MKKILFLHGAIKNAGDFLISHRSQKLIKYFLPECEITPVCERDSESSIKSELNSFDGIVFGGGRSLPIIFIPVILG